MSILWNPAEATVVEKVSLPVITTGTQNMGDGIYWLKAGTPLDEDYAVANDEDAKYIVAEDFFFVSTNPNQDRHVPLVKAGYVDINKAEASAGITFADAAKSALETAGIILVDGLLDAGGGGGGTTVVANPTLAGTEDPLTGLQVGDTKYSVSNVMWLTQSGPNLTLNKTWQEIHDALVGGALIYIKMTDDTYDTSVVLVQITDAANDTSSEQIYVRASSITWYAATVNDYPSQYT